MENDPVWSCTEVIIRHARLSAQQGVKTGPSGVYAMCTDRLDMCCSKI